MQEFLRLLKELLAKVEPRDRLQISMELECFTLYWSYPREDGLVLNEAVTFDPDTPPEYRYRQMGYVVQRFINAYENDGRID